MVLISLSGLRPAFSAVCVCTDRSPPTSMMSCCASRLRLNDWNNLAAMGFDDLAFPFGIEQIGEALRRVIGFHQIGVVGDDAEPDAEARELAVYVLVLGGIELCDLLRHVRRQDAVAFPDDEMGSIR